MRRTIRNGRRTKPDNRARSALPAGMPGRSRSWPASPARSGPRRWKLGRTSAPSRTSVRAEASPRGVRSIITGACEARVRAAPNRMTCPRHSMSCRTNPFASVPLPCQAAGFRSRPTTPSSFRRFCPCGDHAGSGARDSRHIDRVRQRAESLPDLVTHAVLCRLNPSLRQRDGGVRRQISPCTGITTGSARSAIQPPLPQSWALPTGAGANASLTIRG